MGCMRGGGNGNIWVAMMSPQMPTVGAGSSQREDSPARPPPRKPHRPFHPPLCAYHALPIRLRGHGSPAHGWQKCSPRPVGTGLRAIPHFGDAWCATFAAWIRGIPHVLDQDVQSIYRNNQAKPYRPGHCNSLLGGCVCSDVACRVALPTAASRSNRSIAFPKPRRVPNHRVALPKPRCALTTALRSQNRLAINGFVPLHYVAFSNGYPQRAKSCSYEIMFTFASDNPVKLIG